MSSEIVAYRYPHTVAKVEEVLKTASGRKNEKGETELTFESLGWFVTLQPGGIAYPVGPEKPALKEGDRVELVLRPAEPPAASAPAPASPNPSDPKPAAAVEALTHA